MTMNEMKVGTKDKEISLVKWLSAPAGGRGGNYTIIIIIIITTNTTITIMIIIMIIIKENIELRLGRGRV